MNAHNDKYEFSAVLDAAEHAIAESIRKTFTKESLLNAGVWLSQDSVPSMTNQGQTQQEPVCDAVNELCNGDYEAVSCALYSVLSRSDCPFVEMLRQRLAKEWIDLHATNVALAEVEQ